LDVEIQAARHAAQLLQSKAVLYGRAEGDNLASEPTNKSERLRTMSRRKSDARNAANEPGFGESAL